MGPRNQHTMIATDSASQILLVLFTRIVVFVLATESRHRAIHISYRCFRRLPLMWPGARQVRGTGSQIEVLDSHAVAADRVLRLRILMVIAFSFPFIVRFLTA